MKFLYKWSGSDNRIQIKMDIRLNDNGTVLDEDGTVIGKADLDADGVLHLDLDFESANQPNFEFDRVEEPMQKEDYPQTPYILPKGQGKPLSQFVPDTNSAITKAIESHLLNRTNIQE